MSIATPGAHIRLRPLTERVLERLPGSRLAWIIAWALVPWLNAGANLLLDTGGTSAVWEQSRTFVVLNYAALSLAIVITVWGTGRIARHLQTLRGTTGKVLEGDPAERFREMNVVIGPLVAAALTAVASAPARWLATAGRRRCCGERRGWSSGSRSGASCGFMARSISGSIVSDAGNCFGKRLASTPLSGSDRSATSRSWASGCSWPGWSRFS